MTEAASFTSSGTLCAATLYRPPGESAMRPIIVMAHGFGAVRSMRLDAYAERFAAAGYLVLLFDYRSFGDSAGEPRQILSIRRQHEDWRAAVAHARSLPGADPERVVLWGTSLAGGHVLATAARDHRVAAVVAQVPHVSGIAAARSIGVRQSLRLGVHAIADQVGSLLGRAPRYIAAVGEPGELAAMTSPDARPGVERMLEQSGGERPSEVVAARVILFMGLYSPGRSASRIGCPALVQIADRDVITPTRVAGRAAGRLRQGTVHHYDMGHFDPYVAPAFDGVIDDQLTFLRRVVPAP